MTKTNIPYFSLRLLTVFSYFLPFVFYLSTCTSGPEEKNAYNKTDAIKNEASENQIKIDNINSLISSIDTITIDKKAVIAEINAKINTEFANTDNINNLNEPFETIIYFPTNYSLSAIGTMILNKTAFGKILIGISIFISLLTLLLWIIVDKRKIAIHLITANILTISLFIIDCFISDISVLFGVWTLLCLLIIQFLTEVQKRKTKPSADTST